MSDQEINIPQLLFTQFNVIVNKEEFNGCNPTIPGECLPTYVLRYPRHVCQIVSILARACNWGPRSPWLYFHFIEAVDP